MTTFESLPARRMLTNLVAEYQHTTNWVSRETTRRIWTGAFYAKFGFDDPCALTCEQLPAAIELVKSLIAKSRAAGRRRYAHSRTRPTARKAS